MSDSACPRVSLAHYPGMSRFVLDWLAGDQRFLPRTKTTPSPSTPNASPELVSALIESNQRWGLFVREEVESWARGESVALVAGQQVGFAGGPLYTLAKIASLLKLKREYEANGIRATIFFWLATEDHDYNEVAALSLPAKNGQRDLVHLRATRGFESKEAVGPLPIPSPLIDELTTYMAMERPPYLREGITFRDSFAELIATAIGSGVVLVDALLPELRRAGAPLFVSIGAQWDAIQRELATRSAALHDAGYTPQVVPRDGEPYTLFFRLNARGERELISSPPDVSSPETISTSALTRPLLQDFIFRPAVFVGGPAEVSYYAQLGSLHALLGVPMPRVALRGHVLVAPKRIVRYFERFGIAPEEVFSTADDVLAEREPKGVAEIHSIRDEAKRDLMKQIERISDLALPADHALARSIHRSVGHLEYHFDKLAERAVRGLARKDRERYAAVKELIATLYPDRVVQDRIVGWFACWCESGRYLVDRLIDEIEPDSDVFKVVSL
ncbi:MAG: bacillithiol synthase [Acidobacteriota bacterium]|nr:bacillithiol synthase [Acidobacteriota bacterium]